MRVSITTRHPVSSAVREYAEQKLRRLERHASLHDIAMVIDHDAHRLPPATAEVIVHIHHVRLTARVDGTTVQEAIDRVIDRVDRQVLRRKERVTIRKGRVGADGLDGSVAAGSTPGQ